MSVLEWKKLNFFRLIPEADHQKLKQTIKNKVTAHTSNSSYKILCDAAGGIHIFFRSWESISFTAGSSAVLFCAVASECNSLVTLSSGVSSNEVIVNVWDLSKATKRSGAPCVGTAIVSSQNSSVSAMNASYIGSYFCIVMGFDRGEISLFRGSLTRDFSAGFRSFQISTRRITGVEFKSTNSKHLQMFICTHADVFWFNLTETNDVRETLIALDTRTEPARCCALHMGASEKEYFIVGRDDAVYCYTSDGKGPCYAIEGHKRFLAKFANYLVIAIYLTNTALQAKKYLLIIIDVLHKIIVLNKPMESVAGILFDNKSCFILTESNQIFAVYEKDMNTKLNLLLKKHLYDVSLSLVEQDNCDEKRRAHILQLYGDHLYLKGDFASAVEKYIQTIGVVEPYCVIKKFLDSKSVGYLLEYMEALLKTDFATEEHVQLFLNCNSRIRLPEKLVEFLSDIDKDENSYRDIYCTLSETMIGSKLGNSKGDIRDQIFDCSIGKLISLMDNIAEVEKFLLRLNEDQIYSFFKEHSQTLMRSYPQRTTEVLKFICGRNAELLTSPELFIPIFSEHSQYCINFLEHIIAVTPNCKEIVYNYLFKLYLVDWSTKKDSQELLKFLYDHQTKYNEDHILILCKLYSFWDGVLYFFKKHNLFNLSIQYYLQNGDFKNLFCCYNSSETKLSIQSLCDIDLSSEGSVPLISYMLNENLKNKINSPLQIFQKISEIKKFRVSHVRELYAQELSELEKVSAQDSEVVKKMNQELRHLQDLLTNFHTKAMEMRSHICSICKLEIKHPAIYFLCQHSFHKHCLSLYCENKLECVTCTSRSNERLDATNDQNNVSNLAESKDYLTFIENALKKGILNNIFSFDENNTKGQLIKNPFEDIPDNLAISTPPFYKKSKMLSTNPFETDEDDVPKKQYDANLNPFEE